MRGTWHDLSDLDHFERSLRWESAMSADYATVRVAADPSPVKPRSNHLERHDLCGFRLLSLESTACTAHRSSAMTRQDEAADYVVIIVLRTGRERITVGDERFKLRPGDAAVWDPLQVTTFEVEDPVLKWNLMVPRALAERLPGLKGGGLIPAGPMLRLLRGMLEELGNQVPFMSSEELDSAALALSELLAGLRCGAAGLPDSSNRQLLRSVKSWTDANIASGPDPASAASAHSVSVRTINRLFQSEGATFTGHVRRRRLERARLDIITTDATISSVAHRWGFADASHFTRSFVNEFGEAPTEYRRRVAGQFV